MSEAGYVRSPTFAQWAYAAQGGPFDAQARYVLTDRCWPRRARTLLALVRHVRERHTGDDGAPSERDLRAMFVAFAQSPVEDRRGERRLPLELRRPTKSYTVAPTTDARLQRLAELLGKRTEGAVIDALVDAAWVEHGRP
jgi:hypothetical protein